MATVDDILRALHRWAPAPSAQSYDNVGLQIGDAEQEVTRVLVALDLTGAVVDEAVAMGAQLVVTHHPVIFKPISHVRASASQAGLVYRVARAGLAHIAIHTNLDAAKEGVSFALARQLGLQNPRFIAGMPDALQKLVVFVPEDHLHSVRAAMASAGAGLIGEYDSCAFASNGTGFFRASERANPFIGSAGGDLEHAPEVRLEVEVARWDAERVVAAMKQAHPYEEVAYDLFDLRTTSTRHGLGAVGDLEAAVSLQEFLTTVSRAIGVPAVRYAGALESMVRRVAVCGGSGSSFIADAMRAGADAYVTADVTYHRFFDVLDDHDRPRMALIDAGHYETEAVTERLLADYLRQHVEAVDVRITSRPTNPVRYWPDDSSREIKR